MAWIRMQARGDRWLPALILVTWASRLLQCSLKFVHRQSSETTAVRALVIRWYACTKCDNINRYCSQFSVGTWFVERRPFLPNTAWYDSSDGRRAVTSWSFSLNCNSMARRNSFVSLFAAKSIGFLRDRFLLLIKVNLSQIKRTFSARPVFFFVSLNGKACVANMLPKIWKTVSVLARWSQWDLSGVKGLKI